MGPCNPSKSPYIVFVTRRVRTTTVLLLLYLVSMYLVVVGKYLPQALRHLWYRAIPPLAVTSLFDKQQMQSQKLHHFKLYFLHRYPPDIPSFLAMEDPGRYICSLNKHRLPRLTQTVYI